MHNLNIEILDYLDYPILLSDEKLKISWANKKFKRLDQLNEFENILTFEILNSGKIIKLKDVFYEMKVTSIKNKGTLISLFNINKRKILEERLIIKQDIFESLSENLPLGIVLFDDTITYTNPIFEKMIGYKGKDLSGKVFADFLNDESKSIFDSQLEQLIKHKKNSIESKIELIKSDGIKIWISIITRIIRNKTNNSFINVIKDISLDIKKYSELEHLANYDKLTNIYNRRKFEELLNIEYKIVNRYKRDLSAIFFDIDFFKKINDNFGHDTGDEVLRTISKLVSDNLRETDYFARWGGEEFIILLIETNKEEAYLIAEKIRTLVENYKFDKVNTVTISLGVTQLRNERMISFLKRLDNTLYNAKKKGRNISSIL